MYGDTLFASQSFSSPARVVVERMQVFIALACLKIWDGSLCDLFDGFGAESACNISGVRSSGEGAAVLMSLNGTINPAQYVNVMHAAPVVGIEPPRP